MPRLREPIRIPDPRRPVACLSRLQGRRPAEAHVGLRRAIEHPGQIVLRSAADRLRRGRLRIVRRPARAGRLLDELGLSTAHFTWAFRHRNYQLLFGGQLISLTGTWMQSVAESWLVFRLTGSSALLGVTSFVTLAPVFLFATIGGIVADRVDRRRILIITQSISMILPLTLAALTLSGHVRVWHVFVLAGC